MLYILQLIIAFVFIMVLWVNWQINSNSDQISRA